MQETRLGDLVSVADGGPHMDGIIFDIPSRTKVVVAVSDPSRGPIFRTVHPKALSERTLQAPGDRALQLLIRRTPAPVHGAARGEKASGRGSRGHSRGTMHRTTGK